MRLQNRVSPFGDLLAVPARGLSSWASQPCPNFNSFAVVSLASRAQAFDFA
jgi:hypothetical protein